MQETKYPISLGLDCQIQAIPAGSGDPAGASGVVISLHVPYQVYNEAIVVPENVDAIRALVGTVNDGQESIRITDEALGMRRDFLAA